MTERPPLPPSSTTGSRDPALLTRVLEGLRAAEDRFEKVFLASPIPISVSRFEDGRLLDVNPAFAESLGYSREELVGRTSRELGIWKSWNDREDMIRRLRQDGVVRDLETGYRSRDGRTGTALCSLIRARIDAEDCIVCLAVDITARKRAERRLRLLQRVTVTIAEAEDLTSALVDSLREICHTTGWRLGECWLPDGNGAMVLGGAWHWDDLALTRLHRLHRRLVLDDPDSLARETWRTGSSAWIPDLMAVAYPDTADAVDAGLKAAMAIPVLAGRGVAAALIFYLEERSQRDTEAMELVAAVAAQLGVFIRRKRADDPSRRSPAPRPRPVAVPDPPSTPVADDADPFRQVFRSNPLPLMVTTLEGRILDVSREFETGFGYERDALVGHDEVEIGLWESAARRAEVVEGARYGERSRGVEARLRTRTGDLVDVVARARSVALDGEPAILLAFQEVPGRKRRETELELRVLRDPVTGLPTRALFVDRVHRAMLRARRQGTGVAILVLGVDRFRIVNDSLGHGAGDRLLADLARRLTGHLREQDSLAHLGGDRFGVLLEGVADFEATCQAVERLLEAFDAPLATRGTEVHLTARAGLAIGTPQMRDPEDLLRFAGVAMHRAKSSGEPYAIYEPETDRAAIHALHLENDLREAIDHEQLRLEYQPIVSLLTGRVEGAEALVRWDHPEKGLLMPAQFIPLAEESGIVLPLGEWVLHESIRQLRRWRDEGIVDESFRLAFNLSPGQFRRPGLADLLGRLLRDADIPARCIQMEVTEGVALSDPDTVDSLRDLDLAVAIDDVGTGYSSLESLVRLKVDALKIDRTFVAGLIDSPRDDAIVESLLLLARRLGIPVVAEGVERVAQVDRLREFGCAYAQGFFFSKPLRPPLLAALLSRRPHW